jgi:poly(A) polymerase
MVPSCVPSCVFWGRSSEVYGRVTGETLLGQLDEAQRRATARLAFAFAREGARLYLVGGAVRDLLLGRVVPDLDFTTDATPATIRAAAGTAGASGIHSANERFATVGLSLEGVAIEITTFRGEQGGDLHADLAGRDFTINAMALAIVGGPDEPQGALIDPFDGQGDLLRRTIRGVADPHARIADDPLRALRAVRFAADFASIIEPDTCAAILAQGPALGRISRERIGAELTRVLLTADVMTALQELERCGLLEGTLPEVLALVHFDAEGSKDLWTHTRRVVAATPQRATVRWAALLHDIAKPQTYGVQGGEIHFFGHETIGGRIAHGVLSRLRLEREIVEAVRILVELHGRPSQYDADWSDGAVRRLMLDTGPWLADLLDLARADVTSARAWVRRQAQERIDGLEAHCARLLAEQELAKLQSPLDGNALMALFDRRPGPWIRPLKDHLRGLVIDGLLAHDDIDGATNEARRWMTEQEG